MNILMTADTLGGVWTYVMELCSGLKAYGAEITLATMGRRLSPGQAREVAALDHVDVRESSYRLCWMPEPWADVEKAGDWLQELATEVQPDLVHLNDLGHGHLHWQAPVLLVAHSCVCSWWQAVKGESVPSPDWDLYRQRVAAGVLQADLLVAPTQAMLAAFVAMHDNPRSAQVIYNGRSFPARVGWEELSRNKESVFFAAGRIWDEAKNISMLAQVAPGLEWPVVVAGEQQAPEGEHLVLDTIQTLGTLGPEQMAQQLTKAAVYVMPARYEPFGLSVLEAARAGCALVLGDIPSLKEVWGKAACYVAPNDPEQLQSTLNSLARDPGFRQHMAYLAWQRAQQYSTERMTAEYWDSYQRLRTQASGEGRTQPLFAYPKQAAMPLGKERLTGV